MNVTSGDRVIIMCQVEGALTAIVNQVDEERFEVKETETKKQKDDIASASDSDSMQDDDDDSVFSNDGTDSKQVVLLDKKKGKTIDLGSKVKLQISNIIISEGTLISHAELI